MRQLIKHSQFRTRRIARIRMRLFQWKLREKSRMVHGRKVDLTLCNVIALALLVQNYNPR